MEVDFKRTINCNKDKSKVKIQAQNPYLDYLVDTSFPGVNIFFVLSLDQNMGRKGHARYFRPTAKIQHYNAMIDGQNLFDQSAKNYLRIYDNI